jgi:hypothetical protein
MTEHEFKLWIEIYVLHVQSASAITPESRALYGQQAADLAVTMLRQSVETLK